MKTNPPGSAQPARPSAGASRNDDGAPAIASVTAQSVCAQCGSRLSSVDGADGVCISCLLGVGLDQGNVDSFEPWAGQVPAKGPQRLDQDESRDYGAPVEFGDYELLEVIGRGSQGVVYRARQKSLNRTVALKVIAYGQWASEAHLKRFRREAEAAASLDHPSIVPIYEVGERDGSYYFSMKFVEGGQLDEVVRSATADSSRGEREPMMPRRAAELLAKVGRTVHYAHEHGILHRDIKPGNILLDQKGEPHLTDFGLARLVEIESTVTRTREVMGTPSYMAPEQAAGETTKVSRATDVYGLGAVLYQLLTGHPPFAGGTSYETVRLVLDTEPRSPRILNRKIDRELETICLKCLDKDPKRRYSSALALAEDLEHWLRHEPIRARRSGFFTHTRKWVRRKPAITALIASLIAFGATLGWIVWKSEFIRQPDTNGVAVLPFQNLSGDPGNAYFAEGIQDEILTRLAGIADLRVISRTSTQQYQSKPRNLREIAKQLGVANIVEGSVQKAADQVRVNVQLINAQTDSHLWAESYDRKFTDIFGVESEIAKAIAESLQARLTHREEQALAVKPTNNPEAYDAYLRGLAFEARDRYSDPVFANDFHLKATDFYERAVQLDPNFAVAWARLSRLDASLYFRRFDPTSAASGDAAKRALEQAQKLAPSSPETLLAEGFYQYWVLRDYGAAKSTFDHVGKILPSNSDVPFALALIARREERWDKSVAYFEQALALDPRNVQFITQAAPTYAMVRQFPAALKLYDRALDIMPNDTGMMAAKAGIYQAQGNLQEAARLLSGVNEQTPSKSALNVKMDQLQFERNYGEVIRLLQARLARFHYSKIDSRDKVSDQLSLALTQRLAGDTAGAKATAEQARTTLEQLSKDQPNNDIVALFLSHAYALAGQKDLALKEVDRGMTIARDAWARRFFEDNLALTLTIFGENSRAISTLTRLLQTPGRSWFYSTAITPALLRLDPIFDPLRNDPRFQKLCEEKQK